MLLGRRSRYVFLATPSTLAIPQNSPPQSIPAPLVAALPVCAQSCVSVFVRTAWPSAVCSPTNLACLCASQSLSGFTLGEIGLQCLASSCPGSTNRDAALSRKIYQICEGEEDVVPHTHSVLTATSPAPVTATTREVRPLVNAVDGERSESSTARVVTPTPTSVSSSSSESPTSTDTTPLPTAVSTTVSTSTVLSTSVEASPAPSTTAGVSAAQNRPLTREQIIGILVGGGIALAIISGLVILLGLRCGSRRRKRKEDTLGFNVLPSPAKKSFGEKRSDRWYSGSRPVSRESRRPPSLSSPQPLRDLSRPWPSRVDSHSAIGLAISPESRDFPQRTPLTATTAGPSRSGSTLLPDKPVYRPAWPVPLQSQRPASETTVIEDEDHPDGMSQRRRRSSRYSGGMSDRYSLFPDEDDAHLRGYQFARQMSNGTSPVIPPPAPAFESAMRGRRGNQGTSSRKRRSAGHQQRNQRRRPTSNGSMTSFETNNDHELPLTPVRETSGEHEDQRDMSSPISPDRLKYPAIPRSLSATPVTTFATHKPSRPAAPLRNDTYSRNEDLVIATSQALTKATGRSTSNSPPGMTVTGGRTPVMNRGPWSSTEALIVSNANEEEVQRLHLDNELQFARQGLELMREKAAMARKTIELHRERERERQAEEMRRSILGYLSPMSSSSPWPHHQQSPFSGYQYEYPQYEPYHQQQQGVQQQQSHDQYSSRTPQTGVGLGIPTMNGSGTVERRAIPGTITTGTGTPKRGARPSPPPPRPTTRQVNGVNGYVNGSYSQGNQTTKTRRGPELRVVT